jgi:hypothetical protein
MATRRWFQLDSKRRLLAGPGRPQITLLSNQGGGHRRAPRSGGERGRGWKGSLLDRWKCREIPVRSVDVRRVVPSGLVVAVAVLLPVGAGAAAAVGASLALAEAAWVLSLPSRVEIRRGIQ